MEINEILAKMTPVFHEVLDNDQIILTPQLTAKEVEEWDSLSHIRLIVSIEDLFGIKFSLAKVTELKNVGELAALVQSSLKK